MTAEASSKGEINPPLRRVESESKGENESKSEDESENESKSEDEIENESEIE
jgi:hypothetical protein